MYQPRQAITTISSAISQCSVLVTLPQASDVLFNGIGDPFCRRGAARAVSGRTAAAFDLEPELDLVADPGQQGLHAEVGALEAAAGGKAGQVLQGKTMRADLVQAQIQCHLARDPVQAELAVQLAGVGAGLFQALALVVDSWVTLEVEELVRQHLLLPRRIAEVEAVDRDLDLAARLLPMFRIETEAALSQLETPSWMREAQMTEREEHLGMDRIHLVPGRLGCGRHHGAGKGQGKQQRQAQSHIDLAWLWPDRNRRTRYDA